MVKVQGRRYYQKQEDNLQKTSPVSKSRKWIGPPKKNHKEETNKSE